MIGIGCATVIVRPERRRRPAAIDAERLGRALHAAWALELADGLIDSYPDWDLLHSESKQVYRRMAEAVVAAERGGP